MLRLIMNRINHQHHSWARIFSSPLIIIQHRPAYLLTINHSASKTFSSFIIKYHQSTSIIFLSSTSIVFVDYSLLLFFWATPSSSFFLSSRPTFKKKTYCHSCCHVLLWRPYFQWRRGNLTFNRNTSGLRAPRGPPLQSPVLEDLSADTPIVEFPNHTPACAIASVAVNAIEAAAEEPVATKWPRFRHWQITGGRLELLLHGSAQPRIRRQFVVIITSCEA